MSPSESPRRGGNLTPPKTANYIAKALGRKTGDQSIRRVLADLKQDGLAENTGKGWIASGALHPDWLAKTKQAKQTASAFETPATEGSPTP